MSRSPAGALLFRRGLCVRSAVIVVLGTLILATSARAAEPVSQAAREGKSAAPLAPEAMPPVETPSEAGSESAPPGEKLGEPSAEDPPPAETTESEAQAPAPVEAVTEALPPPPPVETLSEPAPAPAPPVEAVKEATVEPIHLTAETAASGTSGAEQGKEGAPTQIASSVVGEAAPAPTGAQVATMPGVPTVAVSATESGPLGAALTMGTRIVEPAVRGVSARATGVQLSAAQRAADLNCELSGLSSPDTDNCTAGWLAGQSLSSTSPAYLITAVAATAGTRAGGAGAGSQGGSRSVTPPPGPAPSGAFGSAAAGSCGTAPTGFFMVGGHLRLVTPRAMRRLRLSCQPWRTAFFVLIPERPG
jgi:hypothetical protein